MSGDNYVAKVFDILNSNPTAQNLDELVEAHVRIGYLAAQAENEYDQSVDRRKYADASAYLAAKTGGEKVSDKMAEAMAMTQCSEYRNEENDAKVRSRKISNLLESIEQAINAIKFLGRYDGAGGGISTPR